MQLRLKGTAHNLAIKGLFKYIDPNSAEAAALIAEGYEKVNWGVDLVKYKDHYTDTNLLPGVKAGNVAPRFYWFGSGIMKYLVNEIKTSASFRQNILNFLFFLYKV